MRFGPALRFQGDFGELELSEARRVEAREMAALLPASLAPSQVGYLTRDAAMRSRTARFARDAGIAFGRVDDARLRSLLEGALARGTLVLRRVERRRVIVQLDTSAEPEALGPVSTTTDWIALSLVDQDGNPVPGVAYSVTCSDGSVYEGTLDDKGKARLEGIAAGSCTVSFPDIDANEYQAA